MNALRVGFVVAVAVGVTWLLGTPTAKAAADSSLAFASAAPAMVQQHAGIGMPLAFCGAVIGLALRRQRAWYHDPRLARAFAPLPQDYTYLPPR